MKSKGFILLKTLTYPTVYVTMFLVIFMIKLDVARHAWPEKSGFVIDRKNGHSKYTLIHFFNSVEIEVDGKRVMTEPHAFVVYSPNTPHYYKSHEPFINDWVHFDLEEGELTGLGFEFNKIYYPANFETITKIIAEIETELFSEKDGYQQLIDLKFKELFIKIGRGINSFEKNGVDMETERKFRFLRGEMMSDLSCNWNVAKMAKHVNLSESRFFTLYKLIFGISPNADIINARIDSAKNMLCFGSKNVGEIAESLGYQNTTHFIRQFKGIVGQTPSEYKRIFKSF